MAIRLSVESRGVTRTYRLKKDVVTFGRSRTSTVFIDDPALSRTHCQLEIEPDQCYLRDLSSSNGTLLNGKPVTRAPVAPGDQIDIGNTSITLTGEGEDTMAIRDDAATARWTADLFTKGAQAKRPKRTKETTDREIRRLHHLLEINKRIAGELDAERVLSLILDSAVELVDAERGFVVLTGEDGLTVPVARDFWRKDIQAPAFELSRSIALEVVRRGEPLIVDDAGEDERFDENESVHGLMIRSVLCVPLRARGRTIGALYLDNRFTRGTFAEGDAAIIEAFADQAAISLWNSDHVAAARQSSERLKVESEGRARQIESMQARLEQVDRHIGLAHDWSAIVGRSESMRTALALVDRVADGDLPVLIQGEGGTGKDLVARAIAKAGRRGGAPFVVVDCARSSSTLTEAELFGGRDATSGAAVDRPGLIERASGGTLFLDEVGEMDLELQRRLLRVLESGEILPGGGGDARRVDVRVISATRHDLEDLRQRGRFRDDLFYRIRGVSIDLPALRDRVDDIPLLIRHFLEARGKSVDVAPKALKALCAHSWPGNVNELRNEIDRLALVCDETVMLRDLSPHVALAQGPPDSLPGGLRAHVERIERDLMQRMLAAHHGNKSRVAAALGLSRLGLRKKMARYGLTDDLPE